MSGAGSLARIGGHVALDFANTAGWHASDERSEHLTSYAEWLAWLRHAGLLPSSALSTLGAAEREHPTRAARALQQVVDLREVMYRIFTATAQKKAPAKADLD